MTAGKKLARESPRKESLQTKQYPQWSQNSATPRKAHATAVQENWMIMVVNPDCINVLRKAKFIFHSK